MTQNKESLLVWVFQTGEPLHIDSETARPMRAMNLSNALVLRGHRVILWSSAFYHQEKRHRSSTSENIKIADRLEIRLIPSRGYRRNVSLERLLDHAQLALNLRKALKAEDEWPDVAFIGYPPIESAATLANWLAGRGVPMLLDVKDQWPAIFLRRLPTQIRWIGGVVLWPYFRIARQAMRRATGLSAMADSFLEWALEFAGRERAETDRVFPLTSPAGQIPEGDLVAARQWWDNRGVPDDGRPRLLFVGSHSSAFDFKGVRDAAESIGRHSRCQFIICGGGELFNKLRALMEGIENVCLPGWVDRPRMEVLAERSQIALAPYNSTRDFEMSIPNKVIDALSLGLPVLSSLRGEVAKLIEENDVGMCYGADTGRTLHDCIEVLINDAALRKSMSEKARTLYEDRFCHEKVYGELASHLEGLTHR